jgi:uncharacterized protein YqgV (UPF0045/DUF77 family)
MRTVLAQVSLYPLRQAHLSPVIDEALEVFRRHGLNVQPGIMSTLLIGNDDVIFSALHEAFGRAVERGEVAMIATISNGCPLSINNKPPL